MTDVFISYSRRDIDFVRGLAKALADRKLSAWVDWEGIAPTAAWLAEIQHAIEGADHFVFIISPDSVTSEICQLELAHAVEHNKRLVPVCFHRVEPERLPAPLRETQWLEIAEGEPFDSAMERLATAIRTDPEAVRRHTRLLTGAIEWQSRRRDRSLLLRGRDLAEAEHWLGTNPQSPAPTELHREFIFESRRAATLLRRIVAAAVTTAALALLIVGGYYLRERQIASEQGRAALSRATAAQALAEQERAFDLALLLAVEAYAISPTLEAEGAMQRILLSKPRLERILATPSAETVGLSFSRNGGQLAAGFGNGAIRIWKEDASGQGTDLAQHVNAPAAACAFNDDLSLAAVGGGQRDAITLRRLTGDESFSLSPPDGHFEVLELRFSPDSRLLASANGRQPYGVTLWDMTTKAVSRSALTNNGGLAAVGFSPDGRMVAAGGWSEQVSVWGVESRRLLQQRTLEGGGQTNGVALTSQWLAVASGDVQLFELSRPQDGPARILRSAGSGVRSVAFDPEGRWLAAGSDEGLVQLWDMRHLESAEEILRAPGSYVDELAFSADGKRLATGGYGQPVRLYATETISRYGRLVGRQAQGVAAVAFSPDGEQFAAAGRERVIDLWSSSGDRHERLKGHVSDIRAVAVTEDGAALISADARILPSAQGRSDVLRWDLRSSPVRLASPAPEAVKLRGIWSMFPDLPALRDAPWPIVFDAHGDTLARRARIHGSVGIEIVSAPDARVLASFETGFQHDLLALALSADGRHVAASAADGRYGVWRVDGAQPLLTARSRQNNSCRAAALSRDGTRVAVACGGELTVYGLEDGVRRLAVIEGSSGYIEALAFDPAGRRVATADSNSGWRLWDVRAARAVGTVFSAPAVIRTMAFSADGEQLLTGDQEGRVILWDIGVTDSLKRACRTAGRELTPDEWHRYLPDRAPHPTCTDVAFEPRGKS